MTIPKCVYNYDQLRNLALPISPPSPPHIHLPPCDYVFVAGFPTHAGSVIPKKDYIYL